MASHLPFCWYFRAGCSPCLCTVFLKSCPTVIGSTDSMPDSPIAKSTTSSGFHVRTLVRTGWGFGLGSSSQKRTIRRQNNEVPACMILYQPFTCLPHCHALSVSHTHKQTCLWSWWYCWDKSRWWTWRGLIRASDRYTFFFQSMFTSR